MNSALSVYRDISAGSAQINPFSDYFQENEEVVKTARPIFEGRGITRDIHVQMPFSCGTQQLGDQRDNGCNAIFAQGQEDMIRRMEADDLPVAYSYDTYDYSKGVFFDYASPDYQKVEKFTTACDPLKEDTTKCLERVFECGDLAWEDCRKYIDYCPAHMRGEQDDICKYNINNELIKKYIAPPRSTAPLVRPELPEFPEPVSKVSPEVILPVETIYMSRPSILIPGRDVVGYGEFFSGQKKIETNCSMTRSSMFC